jgi:hypothetical protein
VRATPRQRHVRAGHPVIRRPAPGRPGARGPVHLGRPRPLTPHAARLGPGRPDALTQRPRLRRHGRPPPTRPAPHAGTKPLQPEPSGRDLHGPDHAGPKFCTPDRIGRGFCGTGVCGTGACGTDACGTGVCGIGICGTGLFGFANCRTGTGVCGIGICGTGNCRTGTGACGIGACGTELFEVESFEVGLFEIAPFPSELFRGGRILRTEHFAAELSWRRVGDPRDRGRSAGH